MPSLTKELCERLVTVTRAAGRRLIHLGAIKVNGEIVKEDIPLKGDELIEVRCRVGFSENPYGWYTAPPRLLGLDKLGIEYAGPSISAEE